MFRTWKGDSSSAQSWALKEEAEEGNKWQEKKSHVHFLRRYHYSLLTPVKRIKFYITYY